MEKIIKKYNSLNRSLKALERSIRRYQKLKEQNIYDFEEIDEKTASLIKHFELVYDQLWKYLREYINRNHSVILDSPRKIFQQCLKSGITDAQETDSLLASIELRNETTHTYNAELAEQVAEEIPQIYELVHTIVIRINPEK